MKEEGEWRGQIKWKGRQQQQNKNIHRRNKVQRGDASQARRRTREQEEKSGQQRRDLTRALKINSRLLDKREAIQDRGATREAAGLRKVSKKRKMCVMTKKTKKKR